MNRLVSVKKLANRIVKKYGLIPPVDPVPIIESLGYRVIEGLNHFGIEAYTNLGNSNEIYINTEVSFAPRRKFTLAHELGHIIIPWHNGDIKCATDTPYSLIKGKQLLDIQELEANIFASELLMPNEWIKQQIPHESIDLEILVKTIKDKAKTSVMACFYALENALPSGHLYYVKKDNTEYWKKFASCRTAIDSLYFKISDNMSFFDTICEHKKHFHISQYDVIHYTLRPCFASKELKVVFNHCCNDITKFLEIISENKPLKILHILSYIIDQLETSYYCILFKNELLLKEYNTSIGYFNINFSEFIRILAIPSKRYSIIKMGEYKLLVMEKKDCVPLDEMIVDPNILLKRITAELYSDSLKMLRKINGVVSATYSTYKTADKTEMYLRLKFRFACDDTYHEFYMHEKFNSYIVSKIDSLLSNRNK